MFGTYFGAVFQVIFFLCGITQNHFKLRFWKRGYSALFKETKERLGLLTTAKKKPVSFREIRWFQKVPSATFSDCVI